MADDEMRERAERELVEKTWLEAQQARLSAETAKLDAERESKRASDLLRQQLEEVEKTRKDAEAARTQQAESEKRQQASEERTMELAKQTNDVEKHKATLHGASQDKARKLVATLVVLCLVCATAAGIVTFATGPQSDMDEERVHIATMVCFLAMALACFGFGLFLIGATGSFTAKGTKGTQTAGIETAAPGLVVMVCATVVIYFALDLVRPPRPPTKDEPEPAKAAEPDRKPVKDAPKPDAPKPSNGSSGSNATTEPVKPVPPP
jgi:hypothetical protein